MRLTDHDYINSEWVVVYAKTNLGTNFIVSIHPDATAPQLISKLEVEHCSCFCEFGQIKITALQVQKGCHLYHLSHSIPLKLVFKSCNAWFIHVDAFQISTTEPHNYLVTPRHGATEEKEQSETSCNGITEKKEQPETLSHDTTEKQQQLETTGHGTTKKQQRPKTLSHGATEAQQQQWKEIFGYGTTIEKQQPETSCCGTTEKQEQERMPNCKLGKCNLGNRVVRAAESLHPCPNRIKLSKLVFASENRYMTLMASAFSFK